MAEARSGRSATLADVARLAGVSAMTVSRVLNDRGNVSDSTRIRVRRAMDQVRYRPNAMARSLVLGRSQTIGVVTFDTAQYGPGSAVLGIERAARERGYGVTITVMERPDHDALRSAVLSLNDRMVDGMVVIAPFTAMAGALRDLGRGTPVVAAEAGHQGEVPIVGIDQGKEGMRDPPQEVAAFLARYGDPFAVILNDEKALAMVEFGATGVPETFVIDSHGKIVGKHTGPIGDPRDPEASAAAVERLAAMVGNAD